MVTDDFLIFAGALLDDSADCRAMKQGEEVVGLVVYFENEIDVFVSDEFKRRWATKGLLREMFYRIFDSYDHATTRVHVGNEESIKATEQVGFKPLYVEDGVIRYAMFEKDFRFRRS